MYVQLGTRLKKQEMISTKITLNVRTFLLVWVVHFGGSASGVPALLSPCLLLFRGVPEPLSVSRVLLDPMLLVVFITYLGVVFVLALLYSLLPFLLVLVVAVSFEDVCAGALLLKGMRCFHTYMATTA